MRLDLDIGPDLGPDLLDRRLDRHTAFHADQQQVQCVREGGHDRLAALLGDMGAVGEEMWIDVIRKMDNVYADLIASQVALEERNAAQEGK